MFSTKAGRRRSWLFAVSVGILVLASATPTAADAGHPWRIINLGVGDQSSASAINDIGHVVGDSEGRPFLWRDGQVTYLLPGSGRATDINNRGQVVGFTIGSDTRRAFLWQDGTITDLGTLPGGSNSYAMGINDHGEVVGYSSVDPFGWTLHAFRWRAGVMTDLGATTQPYERSVANDINNAGVIVGHDGGMATRWRRGQPQPLLDYPAQGEAINDRGDVAGIHAGGAPIGPPHGYLWRSGQVTQIETPPAPPGTIPYVMVMGLNNKAQVAGYSHQGAFIWQEGRMTLLPSLARSSGALDINNRGQIVGISSTADGWYAVLWTRSS